MPYFDILVTYINEFDRDTTGSDDWLRIVQADRLEGQTPKNNQAFSLFLYEQGWYDAFANNAIDSNILYAQAEKEFFGPCGAGSGGTIMIGIKIIKGRADLDYNLITSYGSLKFNGTKEHETELHIDVALANKIEIRDNRVLKLILENKTTQNGEYIYPGRWEGGYPRDKDGNPVSNPSAGRWDEETQTINFDQLYLGTYRFKFMEEYDSYTLTIPPRTDVSDIYDIEMIYDTTLWAFYSNTYTHHPVEIPDEAKDCPVYYTGDDGNTYIQGGNYTGFDTDGDGEIDGGSDDPCACPYCAGTGQLLDCVSSPAVDCTCPYCSGTGRIPGCGDDETYGGEDDDSYSGGQDPITGDCYRLHIRRNRCTGEKINEYLEQIECPETTTDTE